MSIMIGGKPKKKSLEKVIEQKDKALKKEGSSDALKEEAPKKRKTRTSNTAVQTRHHLVIETCTQVGVLGDG